MDEQPSRKRAFSELDGLDEKAPTQKKVRFPKGKKVNPGDVNANAPQDPEDGPSAWENPNKVKKARTSRQLQKVNVHDSVEFFDDNGPAEEHYEDDEAFIDDGIQIEPFNLTKEKEEGYFDKDGNYVEYIGNSEVKDAWLDSIGIDTKFEGRSSAVSNIEVETVDISSKEIAAMKRRIADTLEPGETVLRALRRLKGTTNSRKEKMSAENKLLFDQLTEDAMRLMEDGEYNVYEEKQEVFQREAEGFERLAQARGDGTSTSSASLQSDFSTTNFVSAVTNLANMSTASGGDEMDMFAEDDENATANPASNPNLSESGTVNDYVFDESSGYYYSSSLGYYYDPSSKLYCYAASGQWYSYNEEAGTYDEVPMVEANTT